MSRLVILNQAEELADLPDSEVECLGYETFQRAAVQCHLALTNKQDRLVARCSLWRARNAQDEVTTDGLIGHYAAVDADAGVELLHHAVRQHEQKECDRVIGPMDGSTWHRYRLVTDRGTEPTFFLEPDNPSDWPMHFTNAGFSPVSSYLSALNPDISRVDPRLLAGGTQSDRHYFYHHVWNNWRWRLLFRIFCSRLVMGKLGRDPEYFCYAQGSVAQHILTRLDHAVTELDPSKNPYLHWILRGHHTTVLPHALRPENFVAIRDNLHRLQWHCMSVDEFLTAHPQLRFNCFNLSDIFEYMSRDNFHKLLKKLLNSSHRGARFAYWNMMAERGRPAEMAHILAPQSELAASLHYQDKAFFYSRFVVETVTQHANF